MFAYLKARLNERSTAAFILAGIGAVAALPSPFNWLGFAVLVGGALVPDGPVVVSR
jgi:hypothetical protein